MTEWTDAAVPRHPIAVVAERTGLSQDVLRIWERRYGAVAPVRSPGGQRLYSDADVERLKMLTAATRAGRAIGQVAALSTSEIARLVEEDVAARARGAAPAVALVPPHRTIVDGAFQAMLALDGRRLHEELRRGLMLLGIPAFLETVVTPLLRRIGDQWHAGSVTIVQEHLASAVVHDLVAATLRSLAPHPEARRVLVTTLRGERHTIGAVLAAATAASAGWNVLYLGGDVPVEEIVHAARAAAVRLVAVSMVYPADRELVLDDLRTLRAALPADTRLIVGGSGAEPLDHFLAASGIPLVTTLQELSAALGPGTPTP